MEFNHVAPAKPTSAMELAATISIGATRRCMDVARVSGQHDVGRRPVHGDAIASRCSRLGTVGCIAADEGE